MRGRACRMFVRVTYVDEPFLWRQGGMVSRFMYKYATCNLIQLVGPLQCGFCVVVSHGFVGAHISNVSGGHN